MECLLVSTYRLESASGIVPCMSWELDRIGVAPVEVFPSRIPDIVTRLCYWLSICRLGWRRYCRKSCHWPGVQLIVSTVLVIRLITIVYLWLVREVVGSPLVCHRMCLAFLLLKSWLLRFFASDASIFPCFTPASIISPTETTSEKSLLEFPIIQS